MIVVDVAFQLDEIIIAYTSGIIELTVGLLKDEGTAFCFFNKNFANLEKVKSSVEAIIWFAWV